MSGNITIAIWVDNDKRDVRYSTPLTAINTSEALTFLFEDNGIEDIFCWDYPTDNITATGYKADYARRVQLTINDVTTQGYVIGEFADRNEFDHSPESMYANRDLDFISAAGSMRIQTWHQASLVTFCFVFLFLFLFCVFFSNSFCFFAWFFLIVF